MHSSTLTSQEKHRLLSVLRELDGHSPAERRRFFRRKVQIRATINTLKSPSIIMKSVIADISPHGAALLIPRALPKKAKFILPLRFSEGGGWLVLCEVRNCAPQSERMWRVGARFLEHIDDPRGTEQPPLDWLL
jgi:hypothetical protein